APMIKVAGLAADLEHAVDRGRAADHLAARMVDRSAVETGLGLRLEAPVPARIADGVAIADRHMQPDRAVGAAGLEQQDFGSWIGRQTVGEQAAGRARADDDVVEAIGTV